MLSAPFQLATTVSRSAPSARASREDGAAEACADGGALEAGGGLGQRSSRPLSQRFRLIRELARGNMGSVWLAEPLAGGEPVAIKLMQRLRDDGVEPCEDPVSARRRMLIEASVASRVRSPHVVRVLDYGLDGDEVYIIMELLRGESLAARLHRMGRLAPPAAARLMLQVARGLEHVHEAAVIHRDLKPENIFIVADGGAGFAKLVDFGVAKVVASQGPAPAALEGDIVGTPQYMSPEQVRGSGSLDRRADVWAFGVVAFECLLGQAPFSASNLVDLMLAICSGPLPVPSALGRVPAGFDAWFRTACARNPQERFSGAWQAATALVSLCDAPAPPLQAPRLASAMRRWFRLPPRELLAAADVAP